MKYVSKGIVRVFPGKSDNPLETVPLDYVVNAMLASIPDILAKVRYIAPLCDDFLRF